MIKRMFFLNYNQFVSTSTSHFLASSVNTIDVREFETFTMMFHHEGNTGTVAFTVQAALDPDPTASRWLSVPTATIPVPSSATQGGGYTTTSIKNDWAYLRILAQTDQTALLSFTALTASIRVQIGGHVRHIK